MSHKTKTKKLGFVSGSRKLGMVYFAVIFAVLGTVMLLRSFAATSTLTLTANPSKIWPAGGSSVLSWNGSSVKNCDLDFDNSKTHYGQTGSFVVKNITVTKTYKVTCEKSPGHDKISATTIVTVAPPLPTVKLQASPTTVTKSSASKLTWSSTNADSCTSSGGWSGSRPTAGSKSTGALYSSTTFSLKCTNVTGNASASTTVKVTQPAPIVLPPSPSTPTPTPVQTSSPTPAKTKPTTTKTSSGFTINGLSSDSGYTSASLSWKTNLVATAEVVYSTDNEPVLSVKTTKAGTSQTVNLLNLKPGKNYAFTISAVSKTGGRKVEISGTVSTLGLPVTLTLVSASQQPVSGSVTINNVTKSTNSDGMVGFDLASGDYVASVQSGNKNSEFKFTVLPSDKIPPDVQAFSYTPPVAGSSPIKFIIIFVAFGLLIFGVWKLLRRRSGRQPRVPAMPRPRPETPRQPKHAASAKHPHHAEQPQLPQQAPVQPVPPTAAPNQPYKPVRLVEATANQAAIPGHQQPSGAEPKDMFEEGRERLQREGHLGAPQS